MWKRQAAVETGVNNAPIFSKNNKKKTAGPFNRFLPPCSKIGPFFSTANTLC